MKKLIKILSTLLLVTLCNNKISSMELRQTLTLEKLPIELIKNIIYNEIKQIAIRNKDYNSTHKEIGRFLTNISLINRYFKENFSQYSYTVKEINYIPINLIPITKRTLISKIKADNSNINIIETFYHSINKLKESSNSNTKLN